MSRLYEAMKRVETEREARARETARLVARRTSSLGSWWRGALVGFVAGFGVAAIAVPRLFEPEGGIPPSEASPPAPQVVSPPPPPPSRPAAVEASLPPPTLIWEDDRRHEDALGSTTTLVDAGEPRVDAAAPIAAVPQAPRGPEPVTPGSAPVRVAGTLWVQVGAFRDRDKAARLVAKLTDKRYPATISSSRSGASWLVRVGAYPDRGTAKNTRAALEREGFSGFVVADGDR